MDTSANGTFRVALLSDTHYHFNDLTDALRDINKKKDVAFVIVTGDITENGLQKEFELFHQVMELSEKPYLTVIGNHDYLANGVVVYQQIFGSLNYTFTFNNVKFVMWDDVVWESNKRPDWEWLKENLTPSAELKTTSTAPYHIIPFAHIPPFDEQLSEDQTAYHELLRSQNIKLSIHGHWHEYLNTGLYGIQYVMIGSPQYRSYALLSVTPEELTVTKIVY